MLRRALFLFIALAPILLFGQSDTARATRLSVLGESLYRSDPDSAITLFEEVLDICHTYFEGPKDEGKEDYFTALRATMYNNLAYMYEQQGNIELALEYNAIAIRTYEEQKDTLLLANSLNNVGFIYYKQLEYDKALEYYERSVELKEAVNDNRGLAQTLNNIGLLYKKQRKYNTALTYYQRSLAIRRSINDSVGIPNSLANLGYLYKEIEDYGKALNYYAESIAIQQLRNDKHGLAGAYSNVGTIHLEMGNLDSAQYFGNLAMELANELGYPEPISKAADLLYRVNLNNGNFEKALQYYQLFYQMRDSVLNTETQAATIRQQVQYEYEKEKLAEQKEREKQAALDLAHKETLQVVIYAISGGLLLVLLFSFFLINRVRVINRQKGVIESQKQQVEEINHEITDSLNYASTIQNAILTSDEYLQQAFPEHFVVYQPQGIVSGDFYWAYKAGNKLIWAAVDCTGHGVPGAFMSIIGSTLLNEIIIEKGIVQPAEILNRLRNGVIKALEQKPGTTKKRDGMDMALCVLNTETNELKFAGANNPAWIIGSEEITELKGDKKPVGLSDNMDDFTEHTFALNPNDVIYIFSDGYADQFGGPHGKKFKYKPFRELLQNLSNKPMAEQQQALLTHFNEWKGQLEQVDDVCVFGVRVNS